MHRPQGTAPCLCYAGVCISSSGPCSAYKKMPLLPRYASLSSPGTNLLPWIALGLYLICWSSQCNNSRAAVHTPRSRAPHPVEDCVEAVQQVSCNDEVPRAV